MGSFVYALQGSPFILVTLRYHDCLERGQDMANGVKWALSMNQANFKAFAANACTGALLTPGAIAWIPYGFAAVLVTKSTSFQPSIALQVPFLNANLAMGCHLIEFLAAYNRNLATSRMKSWAFAPQFIGWANGLMAVANTACRQDAILALTGATRAAAAAYENETLPVEEE